MRRKLAMADEEKKDEEIKEEEKVGIFSSFTSKKKKSKKIEETDNAKDELVTSTMVEKFGEDEIVTASEPVPSTPPVSKSLKKTVDATGPVYRKDDKFHMSRPGGVRKYFSGRTK
jgi:hypothetical protein